MTLIGTLLRYPKIHFSEKFEPDDLSGIKDSPYLSKSVSATIDKRQRIGTEI